MDVLILICDQLAATALSCYGGTHRTPNIDRIARRGVRFDRCYTPSPLCMPARAAFWTGRWPHQTGVQSNGREAPVTPISPDTATLGALFADAGWAAHHFGKRHDSGALRGFTVAPVESVGVGADGRWPVNEDTRRDRDTTDKVVGFLRGWDGSRGSRGSRGDRFLAVADLNNPHNICGWIGANQGPHQDAPLPPGVELPPLPDNFEDDPADFAKRPLPVQYVCCSHNRLSQTQGWTRENYRHYLAAYRHYVDRLDAEVGRILDALESRPDADRTLIVFFADHGDGVAAHRMVTKQVTFHEEVTRVPFIIAAPGGPSDAVRAAPLVSLLDLVPTLCDAAGIAPPADGWGRSLMPLVASDRADWPHDYVASEWYTEWGYTLEPGRMIRTDRYKYTRYIEGGGEELYDLRADPGERRSLVGDPAHAEALAAHRRLLERHLQETGDPFFHVEPRVDPRWRSHAPGYANHTGPAAPMVG